MLRQKRSLRMLVAVVLSLGLVAAACSNDDDGATATTAPADDANGDTTTTAGTNDSDADVALPDCPTDALDDASGPVAIDFWWGVPGGDVGTTIEGLVRAYNASQDRVRVNLVLNGSYDDNLDKYRAASAADRPEVIQLEDTATQLLIDSGTTLPAAACIEASDYDTSDYLPRVLDYYTVEDVLWPMPYNVSNPIVYYNKKVFAEAGLDPDAFPTTFDEMRAASEQIVESGAATFGLAFAVTPWEWLEQQFAISGELFVNEENGREGRATEVLFDSPLGEDVLGFLQSLVDDGLAVNVGLNPSGQDNLLKLVDSQQPAAFTVNTTAALATVFSVVEANPTFQAQVEVGVAPLPAIGEVNGGVMVGGGALHLVKDKSDEEIAAAWDFITWLNEPANHADFSVGTGYIPIRESEIEEPVIVEAWTARPEYRVAFDQLVDGVENAASAGPVVGPYRQIRDALVAGMERMFAQNLEPSAVLAEAAEVSNTALVDYARRTGTGG